MNEWADKMDSSLLRAWTPSVGPQPVIGVGQTTVDGPRRQEQVTTTEFQETVAYLRTEFPSECWYFPGVATTVTRFPAPLFAGLLPKDVRIEHVYWFSEEETLKVWTVIPEPDFGLERPLYEAQAFFMDRFPEYECDFSVIYRFGKSIDDIKPQGAHVVF